MEVRDFKPFIDGKMKEHPKITLLECSVSSGDDWNNFMKYSNDAQLKELVCYKMSFVSSKPKELESQFLSVLTKLEKLENLVIFGDHPLVRDETKVSELLSTVELKALSLMKMNLCSWPMEKTFISIKRLILDKTGICDLDSVAKSCPNLKELVFDGSSLVGYVKTQKIIIPSSMKASLTELTLRNVEIDHVEELNITLMPNLILLELESTNVVSTCFDPVPVSKGQDGKYIVDRKVPQLVMLFVIENKSICSLDFIKHYPNLENIMFHPKVTVKVEVKVLRLLKKLVKIDFGSKVVFDTHPSKLVLPQKNWELITEFEDWVCYEGSTPISVGKKTKESSPWKNLRLMDLPRQVKVDMRKATTLCRCVYTSVLTLQGDPVDDVHHFHNVIYDYDRVSKLLESLRDLHDTYQKEWSDPNRLKNSNVVLNTGGVQHFLNHRLLATDESDRKYYEAYIKKLSEIQATVPEVLDLLSQEKMTTTDKQEGLEFVKNLSTMIKIVEKAKAPYETAYAQVVFDETKIRSTTAHKHYTIPITRFGQETHVKLTHRACISSYFLKQLKGSQTSRQS
jgi:hypothetical protein